MSTGHRLTLTDATFDAAGTYRCEVTVPEMEGMTTRGTLRVHVQGAYDGRSSSQVVCFQDSCLSPFPLTSGPPEVTTPGVTEMEAGLENTVDLSCRVRGFPAPSVTWTTADGKVTER